MGPDLRHYPYDLGHLSDLGVPTLSMNGTEADTVGKDSFEQEMMQ